MSWISLSTEIVTGWLSSEYAGHGILGADIPATGDSDGSPVLNDGISAGSEYRWTVVTPPGTGTLTVFEDTSFEYTGDSSSFVYRLYEDGADQGTATVTLSVGAAVSTIAATTANAVGSLASGVGTQCTIAASTANAVGSLASKSAPVCTIGAVTANAVCSLQSSIAGLYTRAPAGSGPQVIAASTYRTSSANTSRPSNIGGQRY